MISWLVRTAWSLLVLGVVAYGTFFVPLGQRTLFEHLSRIARTDEARELGREVGDASEKAGVEVARQVEGLQESDASPSPSPR